MRALGVQLAAALMSKYHSYFPLQCGYILRICGVAGSDKAGPSPWQKEPWSKGEETKRISPSEEKRRWHGDTSGGRAAASEGSG